MNICSFKFTVSFNKKEEMLQHVIIPIKGLKEIENFYEDVLQFSTLRKFNEPKCKNLKR